MIGESQHGFCKEKPSLADLLQHADKGRTVGRA